MQLPDVVRGGGALEAANVEAPVVDEAPAPDAIAEIKPKFRQCTRCGGWFCPEVCWNAKAAWKNAPRVRITPFTRA